MEKAKDKDTLIKMIAEHLSMGEHVRFDPDTLQYGSFCQEWVYEYEDYLDMETLPEDIGESLREWQIDLVEDMRETLSLPRSIDEPWKSRQIEWMAEFASQKQLGGRFAKDVEYALRNRHPFRCFKEVMYRWGIEKEWYAYQADCYQAYVRHEL